MILVVSHFVSFFCVCKWFSRIVCKAKFELCVCARSELFVHTFVWHGAFVFFVSLIFLFCVAFVTKKRDLENKRCEIDATFLLCTLCDSSDVHSFSFWRSFSLHTSHKFFHLEANVSFVPFALCVTNRFIFFVSFVFYSFFFVSDVCTSTGSWKFLKKSNCFVFHKSKNAKFWMRQLNVFTLKARERIRLWALRIQQLAIVLKEKKSLLPRLIRVVARFFFGFYSFLLSVDSRLMINDVLTFFVVLFLQRVFLCWNNSTERIDSLLVCKVLCFSC